MKTLPIPITAVLALLAILLLLTQGFQHQWCPFFRETDPLFARIDHWFGIGIKALIFVAAILLLAMEVLVASGHVDEP